MPPAVLSPSVLLAIGLQGARADTGDTADTGLSPCLGVSAPSTCDKLAPKSAALLGLTALAAAGTRRRRDLIDQLGASGVLPEDVAAQLADAEAGEGTVDGQMDPGDVP